MKNKATIISLLIGISIFAFSCQNSKDEEKVTEKIKIRVERVRAQEMVFPVRTIGKVTLATEQKLAFKIGGIIHKISVTEGQKVKEGDVLASLDLSEIKANVTQAMKGYEKIKRDFDRVQNLYHDSVATLEQFQDIKTALDVSKAKLDIAQFNEKYARIVASSDGVILKQLAEENELIGSGHPVFLFGSEKGNKIVKVNISDKDIIKLAIGDSAHVTFDAYPDEVSRAFVSETGEFSDPYTGTYEVEVKLMEQIKKIPSGFIGRVEMFPAGKQSVISVPMKALFNASEMFGYVWIIKNGKPEKKKLKIEHILNDGAVVKNSISPGDTLVIEGFEKLSNNVEFVIID